MEKDTSIKKSAIVQKDRNFTFSIDRGVSNCLKFLSAIMIALHHYSQFMVHDADYQSINRGGQLFFQLFSSQGGYIGVAIFFLLSGYGLMESELRAHMSFGQFFNKRLKRVIFPLIVLALIWYPIYYGLNLEPETMRTKTIDIILKILNVGGWFVTAILIMYLVFSVFTVTLDRYGKKKALVGLSFLTLVAYIVCDRLLGSFTPLSIPIFSVGIIASLCKNSNNGIFNHSLIYLFAAMAMSVGYCILIHNSQALALHSIINYICIALLIVIFTRFKPHIVFPVLLGEISFDIYLIHKKIITSYMAATGDLINIWFWIAATVIITLLFVVIRKLAWNIYTINHKL